MDYRRHGTFDERWRLVGMVRFACLLPLSCLIVQAADNKAPQTPFTLHEWGTFTSIAGANGMALEWQPFGGPTDLPCFVHRFQIGYKANLSGTVRMETPVIYFYAPQAMTARVHVAFPKGYITEWYPAATQVARPIGSGNIPGTGNVPRGPGMRSPLEGEPDSIEWPEVHIDPSAAPKYPYQFEASHYYAARSTDSAPLTAGGEMEKFLFYRGVGKFQPPIAVENTEGNQLRVRNLATSEIPAAIVFQNSGGKIRYRALGAVKEETFAEFPGAESNLAALKLDLEKILAEQGLFPTEAHAMVDTWRDSWFEEGSRVFYIVPASEMESLLPLQVEPRPDRIARVFVGRVEVILPEMKNIIATAIQNRDRETLEKYGRFLQPIARELGGSGLANEVLKKYLSLESACAVGGKQW
jgi:hypothetical protein